MDTLEFLRSNKHKSADGFTAMAQYYRDNWQWLQYSYAIALKVRRRMQDLGMTQKQLAEAIGCSQQHVSILLNGKVNMTLETLAKLEKALDFDLIGSSLLGLSSPIEENPAKCYLNAPGNDMAVSGIKTSSLVDGYRPRKKKGPKKQ